MTSNRALAAVSAVVGMLGALACSNGTAGLFNGGTGSGGTSSGGGTPGCPSTLTDCLGSCVDTSWDPTNCGACGAACAAGEVCSQGQCGVACLGGSTKCNDGQQEVCVNLASDPAHCGGCGTACAAGEVCSQGQCGVACLGGSTKCNDGEQDVCVDTQNDPLNCGTCSKACAAGEACTLGQCALQCAGGTTKCKVGNQDVCLDTHVDPANCGSCGKACASGEACVSSTCQLSCPPPTVSCSGVCTNTSHDPKHCGKCGNGCTAAQACLSGVCVSLGAASGCKPILAANPSSPDGPYQIDKGQGPIDVYCDMGNGGMTYEAFGFGRHSKTYPDYAILSVAKLGTTVVQNAFIHLVNKQGGLINLELGFKSGNCCIKLAEHQYLDAYLALGSGVFVYPAVPGQSSYDCNPSNGYTAPLWGWYRNKAEYATFPLPASYFATRAPGTTGGCVSDNNPGWFVKSFQ